MGLLVLRERRDKHAFIHTLTFTPTYTGHKDTVIHIHTVYTTYKSTEVVKNKWKPVDEVPHSLESINTSYTHTLFILTVCIQNKTLP